MIPPEEKRKKKKTLVKLITDLCLFTIYFDLTEAASELHMKQIADREAGLQKFLFFPHYFFIIYLFIYL